MDHAQQRELVLFTDREGQRQVITDYLTHLRDGVGYEGPGLLSFYGVSGVGKSALREKGLADFRASLQDNIYDNRPFAIAEVDLDSDTIRLDSPIPEILGRARTALAKAGISTPLFDYLYLVWWMDEHPGQSINLHEQAVVTNMFNVAELLKSLAEAVGNELPLVGLLRSVQALLPGISDWFQRSRAKERFDRDGIPESWPQRDRSERMPVMLALDLLSAIEHTPQTSICLVIDGFERVQSSELKTDAQWAFATLVGEILRCTDTLPAPDGKPLRGRIGFILFGRETLRWADLFRRERLRTDWNNQIDEHCELLGLLEDDARRFLGEAAAWERDHEQAEEVAALIECHVDAILRVAAEHLPDCPPSYLPYYLDLAVLLIRDNAAVFTPDMLGETPGDLEKRFLRYLDPPHRCALQALSLALTFDREVFKFLRSKDYIVGYDAAQFAWLVGDHWSFVHPAGDRPGFHRFHRHMQESLIASLHSTPEEAGRAREIIDTLLDRLAENMRFERPADFGREQEAAYLDAMALLREHEANRLLDAPAAVERSQEINASFEHRQALSLRRPAQEWSLAIALSKLGQEHPNVLRARGNIAYWTGESGDVKAALKLLEALLPDLERVQGPDHSDTLATRGNIAVWTGESGDARAALALFEALLPDLERVQGPDHSDTLMARHNIAACTGASGDAKAALKLFEALLPDRQRALGPDHPDTLATRANIAAWTGESGDAKAALKLLEALLPDRQRVLGLDHPDTLTTRHNIAAWTGERGDAKAALKLFEALLPDQQRALGSDHPDTLATRANIAAWIGVSGDAKAALKLLKALLPDRQRVLGLDHPDTLTTRHNIAAWTGASGDAKAALKLFEALLPDRQRVLGLDHPNTLRTREWIAKLSGEADEYSASCEGHKKHWMSLRFGKAIQKLLRQALLNILAWIRQRRTSPRPNSDGKEDS